MLGLIIQYCYSTILYSYLYESFCNETKQLFKFPLLKEELIKLIEAYSKKLVGYGWRVVSINRTEIWNG